MYSKKIELDMVSLFIDFIISRLSVVRYFPRIIDIKFLNNFEQSGRSCIRVVCYSVEHMLIDIDILYISISNHLPNIGNLVI